MKRVDMLAVLLEAAGARVGGARADRPALNQLVDNLAASVVECYHALGGRLEAPRLRPGPWDLVVNGVMVELDEDLHFNRYRAVTLEAPLYARLTTFPLDTYRRFARDREQDCLSAGSYGGKWTNSSCERHFGPAGPLRQLEGSGAPRWRQRALYDFTKDLAPLHDGTRVARISVWDELPGVPGTLVNDALTGRVDALTSAAALERLLVSRIVEHP